MICAEKSQVFHEMLELFSGVVKGSNSQGKEKSISGANPKQALALVNIQSNFPLVTLKSLN